MDEIHDSVRFEYGQRILVGSIVMAEFGEVKKSVCQRMGIKNQVFFGELSFENILKLTGKEKMQVQEISRYPSMRRDLALVIDKSVIFAEIESIARQTDKKLLKQIALFDVYENENQLGKGKKSYAVSFVFENNDKTLQDSEIDLIMDKLITKLEAETGALIRK